MLNFMCVFPNKRKKYESLVETELLFSFLRLWLRVSNWISPSSGL